MLVAKEVDGIEMGVMEDGTPFLSGAGLAKACGVPRSVIYERAKDWKDGKRDGKLARLLSDAGFDDDLMYVPLDNGRVYAFTESVATIVIEYYALEANNETAKRLFRIMARQGLRQFVYQAVGYSAKSALPAEWQELHDRLLLSTFPAGYFSVFREMFDFMVRARQAGFPIDSQTVPDVSVGLIWATHWNAEGFDLKYGTRIRHVHNYPSYYPQAWSNPQDIWVYPVEAVGAFRRWLDEVYIPGKFPAYLKGKVRNKTLARATADQLLAAVLPAQLNDAGE